MPPEVSRSGPHCAGGGFRQGFYWGHWPDLFADTPYTVAGINLANSAVSKFPCVGVPLEDVSAAHRALESGEDGSRRRVREVKALVQPPILPCW